MSECSDLQHNTYAQWGAYHTHSSTMQCKHTNTLECNANIRTHLSMMARTHLCMQDRIFAHLHDLNILWYSHSCFHGSYSTQQTNTQTNTNKLTTQNNTKTHTTIHTYGLTTHIRTHNTHTYSQHTLVTDCASTGNLPCGWGGSIHGRSIYLPSVSVSRPHPAVSGMSTG